MLHNLLSSEVGDLKVNKWDSTGILVPPKSLRVKGYHYPTMQGVGLGFMSFGLGFRVAGLGFRVYELGLGL